MRTKMTVGLVGGLMIVIQTGTAQGISTIGESDPALGIAVVGYAENVTLANTNVSAKSYNCSADGSWSDLGTAQPGLAATFVSPSLPLLPVDNEFAGISSSPAVDFTSKEDKAGMREHPAIMPSPQISAPEPSTIGLLVLGGAVLAGGALRRRKLTA